MSLGVMRQAVCRDFTATMDSLNIHYDDPLTITAADLLDDFQAIDSTPDLSIDEYFSPEFDFSSFARGPLSPAEGAADSFYHIQTIESTNVSTSTGFIESHSSKFDLTCSTQTSPIAHSPKIKTGLLTPLTTSLSFFDDPDETDGESQNETSINPAVLRKKTKRVKTCKVQKPKKPQHTRSPSKPKTPRAGSWNVKMEVHMSHSDSGRLVVANTGRLPAVESGAGGICPTPKRYSLDGRHSVSECASFADQLELMEFQLMDPKQML